MTQAAPRRHPGGEGGEGSSKTQTIETETDLENICCFNHEFKNIHIFTSACEPFILPHINLLAINSIFLKGKAVRRTKKNHKKVFLAVLLLLAAGVNS